MLIEAGRLTTRATAWFLRSQRLKAPMAETIDRFQPNVEALYGHLARFLDPQARQRVDAQALRWVQAGVPAELANRIAALDTLFAALDVAEIAATTGRPIGTVAGVYFDLGAKLGLEWLRGRVSQLPAENHWQTLAKGAMRDDISGLARTLAANVIADGQSDDVSALVAAWQAQNGNAMERAQRVLTEVQATPTPDLAMVSVALRELRNLT
jgi:glutamate dehydrogenase